MSLTLPDTVTIQPVGTALTHEHTRRPLGRRSESTVQVLAQVELGADRRGKPKGDLQERTAAGEIVFHRPVLTPAGAEASYTPARGDRLLTVDSWHETEASQTLGLYLGDIKTDGAGQLLRARLLSREPGRAAA